MASTCVYHNSNNEKPGGRKTNLKGLQNSFIPKKLCNLVLGRQAENPVYKSESFRFLQKTNSFLLSTPASRRSFKVPVSENYVDPFDRTKNGKEEPPYHEIKERYHAPYYYSDTIKEPAYCSPCSMQRTEKTKIGAELCKSSQCLNSIKMTVQSPSPENEDKLKPRQFISICQIRNSPNCTMTGDCVKRLTISDKTRSELPPSLLVDSLQGHRKFVNDCDRRRLKYTRKIRPFRSKSPLGLTYKDCLTSDEEECDKELSDDHHVQVKIKETGNCSMSRETSSPSPIYRENFGAFNYEESTKCLKSETTTPTPTMTREGLSSRSSTLSCVDSGICLDDTLSLAQSKSKFTGEKGREESGKKCCDACTNVQSRIDHFYARVGRNVSFGELEKNDQFTHVKCANIVVIDQHQHHKRSEKVAPQIVHEEQEMCNLVENTEQMRQDKDLLFTTPPTNCNYVKPPSQCYSSHSDLANQYQLALDPSVKLECQDWFHGRITRSEAESILKATKVSSFLVRNCEKSALNHFSLSLKCSTGFIHIRIEPNPCGTYTLAEQEFPSVPHLIQHFMLHRLPIKGAEHLKLIYPVITQFL